MLNYIKSLIEKNFLAISKNFVKKVTCKHFSLNFQVTLQAKTIPLKSFPGQHVEDNFLV